jgi:hypothetical protein
MPLARPAATPAASSTDQAIQRQPASLAGAASRGESSPLPALVQREAAEEDEQEEVDLDELAQQVLPLIKRLLAIERERALGRLI